MERKDFREQALAFALEQGCEAAETYYTESDSFEANASGGALDRYSVSKISGMSVRVLYGGKNGYAYTQVLDDPRPLVLAAIDNAKVIGVTDAHPMQGKCAYEPVTRAPDPLHEKTEAEKIALALRLEQETLDADPRVKRLAYSEVETASGWISIHNTLGLSAERPTGISVHYAMPVVEADGESKSALSFRMGEDVLDTAATAREAAQAAANALGAKPVPSGTYRVLIENLAMADLLTAFSPMFSADEAQKGCSLLANREGQTVGTPSVTVWDDPFHPAAPRAFDGEGTPCRKKAVIEKGVLKTLLHNCKTAKKAGAESTGNGSRASAASPVSVAPTVLYVESGASTFDSLLEKLGTGLVITELDGLHAGLDTVSGDFSLKASGYLTENGMRVRPVSQITVAGNFLPLLSAVEAVGADFRFAMPEGPLVGSPSVLISALAVAGT